MKQKQVLTVGKLVDILNSQIKDLPSFREQEVKVKISEKGFPATPCVTIETAAIGFDWDNGLILYPSEPIVKKKKGGKDPGNN